MIDTTITSLKPFDQNTLVSLAGKPAYRRGETYYRDERVGDLKLKGNTIVAEVAGSEIYRVTLRHTAKVFEGSCDCPASEGFDFCKHCVATGLKYLSQIQNQEILEGSKGPDLLKNYLLSLDKSTLAAHLQDLIAEDPITEDQWMLKAEMASGKMNHKSFKKRITKAIPYNRDLYRYAQVRSFFARVELLVETLQQLLTGFDPERALELIDYALLRINRALETIDDSGGFRFYSVETLGELHIQALAETGWPIKKIAGYLLDLYSDENAELYPEIPASYLSILGDEGLDIFNEVLQAEWDKLPSLEGKPDQQIEWRTRQPYWHLQAPLLFIAKQRGDLDGEIALRAKIATSDHLLLDLSNLCLQHDRLEEAIDWWQKAAQLAKKSISPARNFSLAEQEIKILCYQEKFDQALELRWSVFQRSPGLERYRQLTAMAGQAGDESDWYQKSIDYLESKTDQLRQAAYDLIAEIHLHEHHPEHALNLATNQKLDPGILLEIIRSNRHQQKEILPLYIRLAEFNIQRGKNDAYHEAINLLKEARSVLDEALQENLHNEVVGLHVKYKVKRNFKKWLEESFPL
ncbi:MAG: hypothetical protein O7F15_08355 [Gammaproteobacteria bacterium]|nr:hypothetical protein [Gammaproteobacteria bacterium]